MKTIAALALILFVAGCGSDDAAVDNSLPPAATKEQSEANATASADGQFNRSSDAN